MPELPDITVYIEAMERRIVGQTLTNIRLASPFLLRTADPPIEAVLRRRVDEIRRLLKADWPKTIEELDARGVVRRHER